MRYVYHRKWSGDEHLLVWFAGNEYTHTLSPTIDGNLKPVTDSTSMRLVRVMECMEGVKHERMFADFWVTHFPDKPAEFKKSKTGADDMRSQTVMECCIEDLIREKASLDEWKQEIANCRKEFSMVEIRNAIMLAVSDTNSGQVADAIVAILNLPE